MKLLWLGAPLDEASLLANSVVSPAANRWQSNLIAALTRAGTDVVAFGHVPEAAWPKGRLWVSSKRARLAPGVDGKITSYVNIPYSRALHLGLAAARWAIGRRGSSGTRPAAVVTYNVPPQSLATGALARNWRIPWIAVLADADYSWLPAITPPSLLPSNWPRAAVHLSWKAYCMDSRSLKLHLDGGTNSFRGGWSLEPRSPQTVVYTGAVNRYGGADVLAAAWPLVQTNQARLVICGRGEHQGLRDLARVDARVTICGMLPDAELEDVLSRASVLVNPRPASIPENALNFPSKLAEYLSYGVPIVSTWTDGLHPHYSDVLVVADEAPSNFAAAIDDALGWSDSRRVSYQNRARAFVEAHLLWSRQADRFLTFVQQIADATA